MTLTDAQLAARRSVIGSSDIACIFTRDGRSLSPFGGPRDVYWSKVGEIERVDTAQTEGGRFIEPAVLDWFQHRMRLTLGRPGLCIQRSVFVQHPTCERLAANLDGTIELTEGCIPVEVKTVNPFAPTAHEWKHPDEAVNAVPLHYWLQVQHQLACTGAPYGFLVALMGTHDLREYRIDARPKLHDRMVREAEAFFDNFVIPRVEPPGDPPREEIVRGIERTDGLSVLIPPDVYATYEAARKTKAEAVAVESAAKCALLAAIGEAEIGECELGKATYLANRNGTRTLRMYPREEIYGDASAFN